VEVFRGRRGEEGEDLEDVDKRYVIYSIVILAMDSVGYSRIVVNGNSSSRGYVWNLLSWV
jgi:hypothetical protein